MDESAAEDALPPMPPILFPGADGSPAMTTVYRFSNSGEPLGTSPAEHKANLDLASPVRYQGQGNLNDPSSRALSAYPALQYNRARWYDPEPGHWLQDFPGLK